MRVVVVYVHGLWFGGGESCVLRRRLARALAAECRVFTYPSMSATSLDTVASLGAYLRGIQADALHLIAHSMGGLLLLDLFEPTRLRHAPGDPHLMRDLPPGRVVLTGSPVRGCRSARRLAKLPFGHLLLGRMGAELLAGPLLERRWSGARELGVIAGNLAFGLGELLGPLDGPSDGTVMVEETDLPGASDQLRVKTSHTGLVFSAEVARQIAAFLQHGRFERPQRGRAEPAPPEAAARA